MHPCKTKNCGHGGTGQSHAFIWSQYTTATKENHAKLEQMSWTELYLFIFIYYLFNNDFNSSNYKASNHSPIIL